MIFDAILAQDQGMLIGPKPFGISMAGVVFVLQGQEFTLHTVVATTLPLGIAAVTAWVLLFIASLHACTLLRARGHSRAPPPQLVTLGNGRVIAVHGACGR